MALSNSDKTRILKMLDNLDNQSRRVALSSMGAFKSWLKHSARWLWEKIKEFLTTKWLENIWNIFFG